MKCYWWIFLIIAAIFILFVLTKKIKINFKFHVNLINLKSYYSAKVLFIKVLCGTTYIEDDNLIIQNTHNMIYSSEKDSDKQMIALMNITKKIIPSTTQIYFCGGIESNAYQTAMLCGFVNSISSIIIALLINSNPDITVFQDIDPIYESNALDLTIKCILKIRLLDVLVALMESAKQYKEKQDAKRK